MDSLRKLMNQDAFAKHLAIELLSLEAGSARARMSVEDFHKNPFKMVHGGAIFTLADYVFQAACNSHGVLAVAIQASITYLQAPQTRILFAEADEVSRSRRLGTYSIRVTDENEKLVALFQGTAYRMPDRPHEEADPA